MKIKSNKKIIIQQTKTIQSISDIIIYSNISKYYNHLRTIAIIFNNNLN